MSVMLNPVISLFCFVFHQLYNRFTFTYGAFSNVVSHGEWWTWTRAAIPFIHGRRTLEVASGSGNLHHDLYDADYLPFGVGLSLAMHNIARHKFASCFPDNSIVTRLVCADVKQLPFPSDHFSSLEFISKPCAE